MTKKKVVMERHHRKPVSLGGKSCPGNCCKIRQTTHRAYHLLFTNGTPHDIAAILNKLIDPDYYLVVRRTKWRKSDD